MNNLGTNGTITLDTANDWDNLTELEQLASEYSDYYKEAYGIRPRFVDTTAWTVEDFKAEFERLGRICEENRLNEARWEAEAIEKFEATVTKLIGMGAKDRETAISWLADAEGSQGDSYLAYCWGLPHGYFSR